MKSLLCSVLLLSLLGCSDADPWSELEIEALEASYTEVDGLIETTVTIDVTYRTNILDGTIYLTPQTLFVETETGQMYPIEPASSENYCDLSLRRGEQVRCWFLAKVPNDEGVPLAVVHMYEGYDYVVATAPISIQQK